MILISIFMAARHAIIQTRLNTVAISGIKLLFPVIRRGTSPTPSNGYFTAGVREHSSRS